MAFRKKFWVYIWLMLDVCQDIGVTNPSSFHYFYLKKEHNSRAFMVILEEISKALVEDDLLIPLWNCWFVLLEVKRLGDDGKDMLHTLLLVEWRDRAVTAKYGEGHKNDLITILVTASFYVCCDGNI